MLKLSFFISIFFIFNLNALELLVTKKVINYKEKIELKDLIIKKVSTFKKGYCKPLKIANLHNNIYEATHYIKKNSVICIKDVKLYKKKSVIFRFGALEIEEDGEIIYENDKLVRIKKRDGKIQTIYKNGRVK